MDQGYLEHGLVAEDRRNVRQLSRNADRAAAVEKSLQHRPQCLGVEPQWRERKCSMKRRDCGGKRIHREHDINRNRYLGLESTCQQLRVRFESRDVARYRARMSQQHLSLRREDGPAARAIE